MALPRGVCGSTSVGPNAQLLQHLPRITRCLAAASDARSCLRRRLPSRQAAAEVDRLMIWDMQLREFWRCIEIGQVPPQRRFHSRCGADHVTSRRSTAERLRWSISGETNWRRIPTTTFDCRPKGLMTPPVPSCSCRLCHCFTGSVSSQTMGVHFECRHPEIASTTAATRLERGHCRLVSPLVAVFRHPPILTR
jgi:hypothetical protein